MSPTFWTSCIYPCAVLCEKTRGSQDIMAASYRAVSVQRIPKDMARDGDDDARRLIDIVYPLCAQEVQGKIDPYSVFAGCYSDLVWRIQLECCSGEAAGLSDDELDALLGSAETQRAAKGVIEQQWQHLTASFKQERALWTSGRHGRAWAGLTLRLLQSLWEHYPVDDALQWPNACLNSNSYPYYDGRDEGGGGHEEEALDMFPGIPTSGRVPGLAEFASCASKLLAQSPTDAVQLLGLLQTVVSGRFAAHEGPPEGAKAHAFLHMLVCLLRTHAIFAGHALSCADTFNKTIQMLRHAPSGFVIGSLGGMLLLQCVARMTAGSDECLPDVAVSISIAIQAGGQILNVHMQPRGREVDDRKWFYRPNFLLAWFRRIPSRVRPSLSLQALLTCANGRKHAFLGEMFSGQA